MSKEDIDSLIGSHFRGVAAPVDTNANPFLVKAIAEPQRYQGQFLSGPRSDFLTEPDLTNDMYDAYAIHQAAMTERRNRQRASMLTLSVPKGTRQKFISSLDKTIIGLRNFIVSDVAVFEIAMGAALVESKDVLEQLTGSKVESLSFGRVQKAADLLVDMHMLNKLAKILGVSDDVRKSVLAHLGSSDAPSTKGKDLSKLSEVLHMLKARKGPDAQVRGMGEARSPEPKRRDPVRPRRVRPT